ncbi:transposase [uncultured Bifidobacterium sp.]|uniref:transposase n=1 Tax=uncultured Bifidobacterium sp. TaxID=165187 RepID=UPI00258951CC|nr:transposase [uncultured Bifidobacterium sp.]
MARYSREQRRRAVGLCERYGHSAADVIRELGCPGKGALLMWYREWLEERRAGVPSRRGERYAMSFVKLW